MDDDEVSDPDTDDDNDDDEEGEVGGLGRSDWHLKGRLASS